MGGSGAEKSFAEMEKVAKVKSIANLTVLTKEVYNCDQEVESFLGKIKNL